MRENVEQRQAGRSARRAGRKAVVGGAALALLLGAGCKREQAEAPPPPPVAQAAPVQAAPPVAARPPAGAPDSFAPLVEQVKGAVVNVDVKSRARGPSPASNPLEDFFGGGRMQQAPVRQGAGSGFIIDPQGRVLTNNHVVEGAVDIQVRLSDGRSYKARILGRDPLTDVALLQLEKVDGALPVVALGDSDAMRVGDWVLAIGNPFGLASSVSAGILSATERNIHAGPYDDFLQTDAAINPGNSGGPLFNLQGQVIGINTAIIGGGTGIGFAVPSNMAKVLLPQLEQGAVRRGWLGVAAQDVTPDLAKALKLSQEKGAVVADVTQGTPAAQAGLRTEDLIVALDGKPLESSRDLTRAVGFKAPGTEVTLGVVREGEKREVKLTLGERPDIEGTGVGPSAREDAVARLESLGLQVEDSGGEAPRRGLSRFWGRAEAQPRGALIAGVEPGSPAERAGLRAGMVVVEAGGQRVGSARELLSAVSGAPEGSVLLLRVRAGGGTLLRALSIG